MKTQPLQKIQIKTQYLTYFWPKLLFCTSKNQAKAKRFFVFSTFDLVLREQVKVLSDNRS